MKGVRFYLEYPNKTEKNKATVKAPGNHKGTVVAVYLEQKRGRWNPSAMIGTSIDGETYISYECACAIFDVPNSQCASSSVSDGYLRELCKRIPERLAREIHPRIIMYLEAP